MRFSSGRWSRLGLWRCCWYIITPLLSLSSSSWSRISRCKYSYSDQLNCSNYLIGTNIRNSLQDGTIIPHYAVRPIGGLHFAGAERLRARLVALKHSKSLQPQTIDTIHVTSDGDEMRITVQNGISGTIVKPLKVLVIHCDALSRMDYTFLEVCAFADFFKKDKDEQKAEVGVIKPICLCHRVWRCWYQTGHARAAWSGATRSPRYRNS